jgi:hypothetical protein
MTVQMGTRPARSRPSWRGLARSLPFVVVAVAVAVIGPLAVRGPTFVDRVTVDNPTAYDVDVDVTGRDGRALNLVFAAAGTTETVRDTIDQGETWVFRFSYGGTDAGALRLDRAALERQDWTVEVPAEVADTLGEAGHEPRSREE